MRARDDPVRARRTSRIFQGQSALDVVEAVFGGDPIARFDARVADAGAIAPRARITLCREIDFDFVQRLMAEEGLSYLFEHANSGDAHTLVIADARAEWPTCTQESIRFTRFSASAAQQTSAWPVGESPVRALAPAQAFALNDRGAFGAPVGFGAKLTLRSFDTISNRRTRYADLLWPFVCLGVRG